MPICVIVDGIFVSYQFTDSKSGAVTWTGVNLGTPSADRIIIVAVSDNAGTSPTGVTVAGVTATKRVDAGHATIWTAAVPSGAAGTITLSGSSSATLQGIGVYAMYGSTTEIPAFTGTGTNSATLNCNSGGFIIACAARSGGAVGAWSVVAQDYNATVGSSGFSSASAVFSTFGSRTPSAVNATTMAAGAWG